MAGPAKDPFTSPAARTDDVDVNDDDDVLRYLDFSELSLPFLEETERNCAMPMNIDDSLLVKYDSADNNEATDHVGVVDDGSVPGALCCSDCSVMRQVVHSNGVQSMKLSINGRPGVFCHATLHVFGVQPEDGEQQYFIDLKDQTLEQVKQFLIEYGLLRLRERHAVVEDSISEFYDVLCVKIGDDSRSSNATTSTFPDHSGLSEFSSDEVLDQNRTVLPKVGIAAQRERTVKLELKDIAEFFHLPIVKASQELNLCPTAIKRICRKFRIDRWPYRKINSIDKMISRLLKDLCSRKGQDVTHIVAKIEELRKERARICTGHSQNKEKYF